jgi:ABC-type molybdate transport system ATPase subunit
MGVARAHLLDRKPATLSGGEKQRVAVGRSLTTSSMRKRLPSSVFTPAIR